MWMPLSYRPSFLDVLIGRTAKKSFCRYTDLFDMNSQELDHMYISPSIAKQKPKFEHVNVNTWVSFDDAASDHDPSVAQMNLCGARSGR